MHVHPPITVKIMDTPVVKDMKLSWTPEVVTLWMLMHPHIHLLKLRYVIYTLPYIPSENVLCMKSKSNVISSKGMCKGVCHTCISVSVCVPGPRRWSWASANASPTCMLNKAYSSFSFLLYWHDFSCLALFSPSSTASSCPWHSGSLRQTTQLHLGLGDHGH